jgi:Glyoxalase/Bleomycin resistance protein/Dioxygenase superfamily
MSRLYGPIRQMGYVVNDVEASAAYWAHVFGVGPFFRMDNIVYKDVKYKNRLIEIDVSVALAYSGDLQIELIQQNGSIPTIYSDFLNEHGEGLQHIAVWPEDYEKGLESIQQAGGELLMEGEAGSGSRFAYFGGLVHAGAVLEVVTPSSAAIKLFKMLKDASETWDGSMPVRSFSARKWSAKSES